MITNSKSVAVKCGGFSAKATLTSGQCFRWSERGGRMCGTAFGRYIELEQDGEYLTIFGSDEDEYEKVWRSYFDMDSDYAAIRDELVEAEPRLAQAAQYASGVHILAQEPWETLCSFVISQNNNIPRIRGIIARLCLNYGETALRGECAEDEAEGRAFPSAERLASISEDKLREFGCGYRAEYLAGLARGVCDGSIDLDAVRQAPVEEARELLRRIKGVGPKVAECALLYGFGRLECFPVDVWIKRAMERDFKDCENLIRGKNAGVAQQYIYEYIRHTAQHN